MKAKYFKGGEQNIHMTNYSGDSEDWTGGQQSLILQNFIILN
jgi:hypothetical protein